MPTELVPVKLTPRQEHFCHLFTATRNATGSYREAYNRHNSSANYNGSAAAKLMLNCNINKRIEQLSANLVLDSHIKPVVILNEFADLALSNIAEMVDDKYALKPMRELSNGQKKSIKKIKKTTTRRYGKEGELKGEVEVVEVELFDKIKALESLAKFTGVLEPEKMTQIFMQVNNQTSNNVTIDPDSIPIELLEQIMKAQQQKTIEANEND